MIILLFSGILAFSIHSSSSQETRVIKILDAHTGLNSTTVGTDSEVMPLGGYRFTVNVTLEGATNFLFDYQVAIRFDQTRINCTAAWIPKNDPNFVFSNGRIQTVDPMIINSIGLVTLGAATLIPNYVNVSRGLLCQINFTAFRAGNSALDFIPTDNPMNEFDTFLWDDQQHYISFNSQSFSVSASAARTPPVASFTYEPSNPNVNENVTFDASTSYDPVGDVTSYSWDFNDGTNFTAANATVTHTFASKRAYFVNLTVQDNYTLSNSVVREVQVGVIPYVNFTYEPLELRANQPVTFNASGSYDVDGIITNYVWDFGDSSPQVNLTDSTATHVFTDKGKYSVQLTIYDNDTLHNSTSQEILVGKLPTVIFTYSPQNPAADETVTFNASQCQAGEVGDNITLLMWDFGDYNSAEVNVSSSNLPSPFVTEHVYIIQGGNYTVNLTAFDNNGLYNSYSQNISVKINSPVTGTDYTIYVVAGIIVVAILIVALIFVRRRKKQTRAEQKKETIKK